MSAVDDIVGQLPISQLAQQVGADEATTRSAVEQAVPALLTGMQANAQDPGGAASLAEALTQHQGEVPQVDQVNVAEGDTIVNHVFGDNREAVVSQLGGLGGGNNDMIKKLLPILAPIVLGYLSKNILQGGSGGGLGDILGQLTGQGGQAQAQAPAADGQAPAQGQPTEQAGGGGLADVLGGMLGGGSAGGGGLGDVLGGLLGAGRKN